MIRVDLSVLEERLEEDAAALEAAARPASQAAAQVFYIAARRNVMEIRRKSGNLINSIYQAYSERSSGVGKATYHVSWNPRKAKHGHLLEWGHIQRYVSYVGSDGNWYTAIRPEMRGKPKPKRKATQTTKDAYYVPLKEPKQIAAKAFMRRAGSMSEQAVAAATAEIMRAIE